MRSISLQDKQRAQTSVEKIFKRKQFKTIMSKHIVNHFLNFEANFRASNENVGKKVSQNLTRVQLGYSIQQQISLVKSEIVTNPTTRQEDCSAEHIIWRSMKIFWSDLLGLASTTCPNRFLAYSVMALVTYKLVQFPPVHNIAQEY